ncbi:MAG: hypothetical protein R2755_01420 [Acidimicrobiales bacterium]
MASRLISRAGGVRLAGDRYCNQPLPADALEVVGAAAAGGSGLTVDGYGNRVLILVK